jgi:hypothetical protein
MVGKIFEQLTDPIDKVTAEDGQTEGFFRYVYS